MHEPDFQCLQKDLLRVGIAPRHVHRLVGELREHLDDLVADELSSGRDPQIAYRNAVQQMGDLRDVAIAMRARPELRSWSYRYPRLALVIYPLTCLALLPAAPVVAGIAHAPQLARWASCLALGGFVTAAIFLVLQLSITPT